MAAELATAALGRAARRQRWRWPLSPPPTMPGELLVGITYVVVVFSILGQGTPIGLLATRLQRGLSRPVAE